MTNINESILVEEWVDKENAYKIGRFNKTTNFLLPTVGLGIFQVKTINSYLVNAYLEDADLEHDFIRPLFVLFQISEVQKKVWIEFEKKLRANVHYIYDYYVGTRNGEDLLMFVFSVPQELKEIYSRFKRGAYSKFPEEYKKLFPKEALNNKKIVESKVYGVLYKTASLKIYLTEEFVLNKKDVEDFHKMLEESEEWWDLPHPEEEYFKYQKQ